MAVSYQTDSFYAEATVRRPASGRYGNGFCFYLFPPNSSDVKIEVCECCQHCRRSVGCSAISLSPSPFLCTFTLRIGIRLGYFTFPTCMVRALDSVLVLKIPLDMVGSRDYSLVYPVYAKGAVSLIYFTQEILFSNPDTTSEIGETINLFLTPVVEALVIEC